MLGTYHPVLVGDIEELGGVNLAVLGESLGQHLLEPMTATPSCAVIFVGSAVEGATSSPYGFSQEETLPR